MRELIDAVFKGKKFDWTELATPKLFGEDSKKAILLIHGFTGVGFEMWPLALELAEMGFKVKVPVLPGHGTNWKDLATKTHDDWIQAVNQELDDLKEQGHEEIHVGGLSMGGALTLYLSATRDDVKTAFTLAAPVVIKNWKAKFLPLYKIFKKTIKNDVEVMLDTKIRNTHYMKIYLERYGVIALKSYEEVFTLIRKTRELLPRIKIPLLIIQGKKDSVVHPVNAQLIYNGVSSKDKAIVWLNKSNHVIPWDVEANKAINAIKDFLATRMNA